MDQSFSLILNAKRLFRKFLVDGYTMSESERLFFIRNQQKILRCESYENLRNQQALGSTNISNIGQRVILSSSFTDGARYMMRNYLDAMSLCKWFGYPDFFITFTCNSKWPEVQRFLKDTQLHPEDRQDILRRLFKIKLDAFIKDIRENKVFGKVQVVVYTIEFQKRGLPHSHICLFMHADCKLPTVEYIDPIISTEIPNIDDDLELYSLVKEFMIHGPCGAENLNFPCMVEKKCSKNFPKQFCNHNSVDSNGFPLYSRRNDGHFVEKSSVQLDNRNVVPYNKYLLKRYHTHINVEWCNQGSSIKHPVVIRLPFHLPSQQQVVYKADDDIEDVLDRPSIASSMFTSWMKCNEINKEAQKLTYVEFPTNFVWKLKGLIWKPGEVGYAIGRIHSVSPKLGEAYFLRILLNKVKGPKSFEEIRTVNGELCSSFKDACYNLGLLDDDKQFIDAIKEASLSGYGFYLRFLFVTMLLSNSLCKPEIVWQNTWEYLSDGILYNQQQRLKSPDADSVLSSNNRLITEEIDYDIPNLKNVFDRLFVALTNEQQDIFLDIMDAVEVYSLFMVMVEQNKSKK
ncbi:unnamed protein product [Lactuca virosa]|uniref:Helitron helicase-like domain-containing protein n=1 Tax=Lactuca virosa TaxID=75947 RepID=A0AAU9LEV5_9ASTR|nr:unnamed protein product [Lactuca virosa]